MRNFLRKLVGKEKPAKASVAKTVETDVDKKLQVSRRGMLKSLAAMGVIACVGEGCSKGKDLEEMFFQNFNIHEYQPIAASERKERRDDEVFDQKKLESSFKEEYQKIFSVELPEELAKIVYQDGVAKMALGTHDSIEIEKLFVSRGYNVKKIVFKGDAKKEFTLTIDFKSPENFLEINNTKNGVAIRSKNLSNMVGVLELSSKGRGILINEGEQRLTQGFYLEVEPRMVFLANNGEVGRFDYEGKNQFIDASGKYLEIKDARSTIEFLEKSKSDEMVKAMAANGYQFGEHILQKASLDFSDIRDANQLRKLIALLPRSPETYALLLERIVEYRASDVTESDEFRDPITFLKSKWGDCDDFALSNYFWAFLNSYTPYLVYLKKEEKPHVLVYYIDENAKMVVMDNNKVTTLKENEDIYSYLNRGQIYQVTEIVHY